jgi:hypothetical protein
MEELSLFLRKPGLLSEDSYTVRTKVPVTLFSEFVKAVQGERLTLLNRMPVPSLICAMN